MDWTQEAIDTVFRLRAEGLFQREIGERLGCSEQAIRWRVKKGPVAFVKPEFSDEWPAAKIAQLRQLWREGCSSHEIGRRMGGLSKNAVVGKAHRLGLPARPSPIIRDGRERAPRAPRASRATLPGIELPQRQQGQRNIIGPTLAGIVPQPAPKPAGRVRTCCWPMWGDKERAGPEPLFCGQPVAPSLPDRPAKSYCGPHCGIAYVRVHDRREDAHFQLDEHATAIEARRVA